MTIKKNPKKTLSSIVLAGALALGGAGCSHHPEYQEGKVTKESGTVFGNEFVKFDNLSYVLTVETDQGKYVIDVSERYSKPLTALAEAIEVGDRISFRTNYEFFYYDKDYFSVIDRIGSRIGSVPSDEIKLLGK